MSIEEAKCLVMRTASLSVASINYLVNEEEIRNVSYKIKAMAIIMDKIKIFLKKRFLKTLFLNISTDPPPFLG
jgi:hypothetical protein